MTEAFATLAGKPVAGLTLTAGAGGPWYADVDLEVDDAIPAGRIALACRGATLSCTADPAASGTFGLQRKVRVVGGANGWGDTYPATSYQSDNGVSAKMAAEALAKLAGETLGDFMPGSPKMGANWFRARDSAGQNLEALAGGVPWWVDYAGVTHVRARAIAPAVAGSYEVLGFDPRSGRAQLAIDDLTALQVGAVLSDRLDTAQVVQQLTITLTGATLRAEAVCGDNVQSLNLLERVIETLVTFFMHRELSGVYRYRVVRTAADGRVDLQAVRKNGRMPDAILVPQWPGLPGATCDLTEGSIVGVSFLDCDRNLPALAHYSGEQDSRSVAKGITLGGRSTAAEVARKGDPVKSLFPPMVCTGTMIVSGVPTPFTGVFVSTTGQMLGVIESGSPRLKVGVGS